MNIREKENQNELNQTELYQNGLYQTNNINMVKNHAYLMMACPPCEIFQLNPFMIYKILYYKTHF